jgi:hypothetical protein
MPSGRKPYGTTPPREDIVIMYFNENMSQVEIAEKYGTTQKVVWRWFKTLGLNARVAAKRDQKGENNSSWKGSKATYAAYHYRVRSVKGKADRCDECGRNDGGITYDWANQTGKYEDVNDYKMMCRSCHFKKDGHKNNFPKRGEDGKQKKNY